MENEHLQDDGTHVTIFGTTIELDDFIDESSSAVICTSTTNIDMGLDKKNRSALIVKIIDKIEENYQTNVFNSGKYDINHIDKGDGVAIDYAKLKERPFDELLMTSIKNPTSDFTVKSFMSMSADDDNVAAFSAYSIVSAPSYDFMFVMDNGTISAVMYTNEGRVYSSNAYLKDDNNYYLEMSEYVEVALNQYIRRDFKVLGGNFEIDCAMEIIIQAYAKLGITNIVKMLEISEQYFDDLDDGEDEEK